MQATLELYDIGHDLILVRADNAFTGKQTEMTIPLPEGVSQKKLLYDIDMWKQGAFIQDALPYLDDAQREFLMTGLTPEDWDEMFEEEDKKE